MSDELSRIESLTDLQHHWYHLQMDRSESGHPVPICYCPSAKDKETCVHQRYLTEEGPPSSWALEGGVMFVCSWRDLTENSRPCRACDFVLERYRRRWADKSVFCLRRGSPFRGQA